MSGMIGPKMIRFDLTGTVAGWLAGAPNRGLLLGLDGRIPGLATFAGGRPERPGPILRLIVHPSRRGEKPIA